MLKLKRKKKYDSYATTQKNAFYVLSNIGPFLFHTWNVQEQGVVKNEWETWHAALNLSKYFRKL